jgi:signal transduction histidine kinase
MKSTLKILNLEDDPEDFDIINFILESSGLSFLPKRVDTREDFLNAVRDFQPDIILSDHSLPTFSSTEALSLCNENNFQIPFILVTGAVSEEFAVSCMKLGAKDYVLKSSLTRLPNAIENAIKHRDAERGKWSAISSLADQNDKLIKINKELDSFVYSVSHNLRAPLMSVLGLLNLAKKENTNKNLHQYHEMMENSIQKLDNTLKEILEYSRNSRQELKIEQLNIKSLIKDSIDIMKFFDGFQLLEMRYSIKCEVPLYSDSYRLSVILNNLISNAVKYLDNNKDKPFFNIECVIDEKNAKLIFEDNGIGISKELLPKIFTMFFRATESKEGSGLGLYIVKEAIELLKGKIEIESEFGQGTKFTIDIPNHLPITNDEKVPIHSALAT